MTCPIRTAHFRAARASMDEALDMDTRREFARIEAHLTDAMSERSSATVFWAIVIGMLLGFGLLLGFLHLIAWLT